MEDEKRNLHLAAENSVTAEKIGEKLLIQVRGRLGLNLHGEFRRAYQPLLRGINACEVDMAQCTGLDSSGLALLLILRDNTHLESEQLLLKNCCESVVRVLDYANFNKLFTIIPQ